MKKTILALITAALLLGACACGKTDLPENADPSAADDAVIGEETENTDGGEDTADEETEDGPMIGMPNPVTEYGTLEEVNELIGGKLAKPAVMGVTDSRYAVINAGEYKIGEYVFSVAGVEYCMRNAFVTNDISGVYVGGDPAFADGTSDETEYVYTDNEKLARWFNIDGQYVLIAKDAASLDGDTFHMIVEEMMMITGSADGSSLEAFYRGLEGDYADSFSQRASMIVTADGANGVKLTVHWGNSADEYVQWEMTAADYGDGLLSYSDCKKTICTVLDETTMDEEVEYENGEGFFSPTSEGALLWNGAAEADCLECVFERIPE